MSDDDASSGFLLGFGLLWCAGMVSIGVTTALHIGDYSGWSLGSAVAAAVMLFVCYIGGIAGFAFISGCSADDPGVI